jgi:tetratricopeptide (TPR) repeat protein
MSSIPDHPDGRRRAVSVLALKLWETTEALDSGLENPADVLDLLVTALAKGEDTHETWEMLHAAAVREDRVGDLALAYQQISADKRVKLMLPEHQAHLHLQEAWLLAEQLGDKEGAQAAAERALSAVPGHGGAFALLEELLTDQAAASRLAQHYFDASARATDAESEIALLRRGAELVKGDEGAADLAVEIGQRILKLNPSDGAAREAVMQRLLSRGRHKDVVDLLEDALRKEPPPTPEEALLWREQAMDICLGVLKDSQRALGHVEGLLLLDPTHPHARKLAEELLEHRQLGLRAAAALSDAYEKAGETERAVEMLSHELRQVRGPRRVEVQRRLGALRQDVLGDLAGALELLAPVVAGDPGDDELRERFVRLSLELNQSAQAARLLSRALQTSRDPGVRARVATDVGEVYVRSGDPKKALSAFQQALELAADDGATLRAARYLAKVHTEASEPKQLVTALELLIKLEPEREARQVAARRLVDLGDAIGDPARAALAWRSLVGSPWSAEALERLEGLYRASGDDEGLADVLGLRAEASRDPEEARSLAFQSAELRSSRPRDRALAIRAWQQLSERYGASPEINDRLLPLLEAEGRYEDVAALLERVAETAPPEQRIEVLARLGQLRLTQLGDTRGALATFSEVLRVNPTEPTSRAALERMLTAGEARLAAADVLTPIYRAEGSKLGLVRVLVTRAELAEGGGSFAALAEAMQLSERELGNREQALEIAGRALERAAATGDGAELARWLGEVERLGEDGAPRRAALLEAALGGRSVSTPELFELSRAAGAALASAGELSRAVDVYRKALAYAPSSREIVQRVDELLAQLGAPEERLGLYRAALSEETDPARRRELLHALATLQGKELGDAASALETWRQATLEDPRDPIAHDAFSAALAEASDWDGLYAELSRVLPSLEGERRSVALLRMGEVAATRGDPQTALTHYRELLDNADLADDVLDVIEHLARECGDGRTARVSLERRLARTAEPSERAGLLERLGNVLAWMQEDAGGAARVWLEGARLSEGRNVERARQLYERVLDADPTSREAAERLVELLAGLGDWPRLEEVCGLLVGLEHERDVVMLLLGLEEQAVQAGQYEVLGRLLDLGIARVGAIRARHLQLAKARALARAGGHEEEAAALFRSLLARSGESGEDAQADAEVFASFLRAAPLTPERAKDWRWLYAFRLEHTANPAGVLQEWAATEERVLGDAARAAELYRKLVELDPERLDALGELARLELALGHTEQAYEALGALRARTDGEQRHAAALKLAELLITPLGRPAEALEVIEPVLEANPGELGALRIVHHALEAPECRARAAALLERIASASDDRVSRAEVIEALLAVSAQAPELARARTGWLLQLLKTKTNQPEEALALSLKGAEAAPDAEELWDIALDMSRRLNDPQPLAEAYERAIERELPAELADTLGRRMVEFLEEWFDDADRVMRLLDRILTLCPTADWAFDRQKLAFNAQGRWQELFQLYDRRLASDLPRGEEIELLREAAMAAKDFAGDATRAITYLERLNRLSPGDTRVDAALERLYERHGRKRPLIDLLSVRMASDKAADRTELTARIAALWLDLGDAAPAFTLSAPLLASKSDERTAVALLERIVPMPSALSQRLHDGTRVLESTAKLLEKHYRAAKSTLDVVRMLEIQVECAEDLSVRPTLLEEVVRLRLDALDDAEGAFETLCALIALDPADEHREKLGQLAARLNAEERRVATLVQVAQASAQPALKASLLLEAAQVCDGPLASVDRAADFYREVVALRDRNAGTGLVAARRLADILRERDANPELVGLLEVLAGLETEVPARSAALGEAAERALTALLDPSRAIRDFRAQRELDDENVSALDGLCRALEAAERWDELVKSLETRATRAESSDAARADRVRIATIHADVRRSPDDAIQAWRRVRALHGPDLETFEALGKLFTGERRWDELVALLSEEAEREQDPTRRAQLLQKLGEVHEQHTGKPLSAVDAYAAAGDYESAVRVTAKRDGELTDAIEVAERLFELCVDAWDDDAPAAVPQTADWALAELVARLLERGNAAPAVERLLFAASLQFSTKRRRELRREAACLCSDQLGDGERAIELFQALLAEEPSDEVAISSVTRVALLLEERGRSADLVDLWEKQAAARARQSNEAGAAELWTRAASILEEELEDRDRALADYQRAADLGGEAALEALARIYESEGDVPKLAEALERLCALSSSDTIAARALRLSAAYYSSDLRKRATESLEHAVPRAADASALRKRLAELYREARDVTSLAALLEEEARQSQDDREKLGYLREAASLHTEQRKDPASAIPLLEEAVRLEADDPKLRVKLALALSACARYAEAAGVLREQLERYGARRPKDRAEVHYELARVLLASDDEGTALTELDAASRIDPAHPAISALLASLAFRRGELDRAERMYRALLLTAGRDEQKGGPGRTEALVALSEIATRRGDAGRAQEFLESAFEAALENPREAQLYEAALRAGGKDADLARLLEARLGAGLGAEAAALALGELVELRKRAGQGPDAVRNAILPRAREVLRALRAAESAEDAAWAALGRVFEELADPDSEALVIESRVNLSTRSSRPPADPDLFYRLAESRLSDPAQRSQGFSLLERAFDARADIPRAEGLLRIHVADDEQDPHAIALLERVARASGDTRSLARALSLRVGMPDATPASVREGVELAKSLGDAKLVQHLVESAIANTRLSLSSSELSWLRLELADLHEAQGDLETAFDLREKAAPELAPAEAHALLLDIATRSEAMGATERAVRAYEALRAEDPGDVRVSRPLLMLYGKLGRTDAWLELAEHVIPAVETAEERSGLRLELARALLERGGSLDTAIDALRDLLLDQPGHLEASGLLSELLERAGRFDELSQLLSIEIESAVERGDANATHRHSTRLVAVLELAGRLEDAMSVCTAALDRVPDDRHLLVACVRIAEGIGDAERLGDALERTLSVERGPTASELSRRLAALRTENNDAVGAERALELGFLGNPEDEELLEILVERFLGAEEHARAAALLERAVQARPTDTELLEKLVTARSLAGEQDEALAVLERLIAADPENLELLRRRAAMLDDIGRDELAVADLERVYASDPASAPELVRALERAIARAEPPDDARYSLRLVDVLEAAGDLPGARARLAEFLGHQPEDLGGFRRLADLDQRIGNVNEALLTLERLSGLESGSALVEVALKLADLAETGDKPELARSALERAFAAEPSHDELRTRLEALYARIGATRELSELLLQQAAVSQDREEHKLLVLRAAEALLSSQDPEAAVRVLEVLREEAPDSIEATVLLARAYAEAGRADQGLGALQAVVEAQRGRRNKALIPVYQQIAKLHLEEGFLTDAMESMAKAFELDSKNAKLALQLGRLALDSEELEVAQRAFRAVTIMRAPSPDEPGGAEPGDKADANYNLALLAHKQGDSRKAKVLVSKALSDDPDHEGARALSSEITGR